MIAFQRHLNERLQRTTEAHGVTAAQLNTFILDHVDDPAHTAVKVVRAPDSGKIRAYSAHHEFNAANGIALPYHDSVAEATAQQLQTDISAMANAGYDTAQALKAYEDGTSEYVDRVVEICHDTATDVLWLVIGRTREADEFIQMLTVAVGNDQRAADIEEHVRELHRESADLTGETAAHAVVCAACLPTDKLHEIGLSQATIDRLRSIDIPNYDPDAEQAEAPTPRQTAAPVQHPEPQRDADDEDDEDNAIAEPPIPRLAGMPYRGIQAVPADPAGFSPIAGERIIFGSTTPEEFATFISHHPGITAAAFTPDKAFTYFRYAVNAPTGFSKRIPYFSYDQTGKMMIVDIVRSKHVTVYEVDASNVQFRRAVFTQDVSTWGDQIIWRQIRERAYKQSRLGINVLYDEHNIYRQLVGINQPCPFRVGLMVPAAQNATPAAGEAPATQQTQPVQPTQQRQRQPRQPRDNSVQQRNTQIEQQLAQTDLGFATVKFVPANPSPRDRIRSMRTNPTVPTLFIEFPGTDTTEYTGQAAIQFLERIDLWGSELQQIWQEISDENENAQVVVSLNGRYR